MGDQVVEVLRKFDVPSVEQVIAVPMNSFDRVPQRSAVRRPQKAEQLVEVPTEPRSLPRKPWGGGKQRHWPSTSFTIQFLRVGVGEDEAGDALSAAYEALRRLRRRRGVIDRRRGAVSASSSGVPSVAVLWRLERRQWVGGREGGEGGGLQLLSGRGLELITQVRAQLVSENVACMHRHVVVDIHALVVNTLLKQQQHSGPGHVAWTTGNLGFWMD